MARALQDVPERAISQADKQRFVTAMQRASQMEHAADEST